MRDKLIRILVCTAILIPTMILALAMRYGEWVYTGMAIRWLGG